MKRIAIIGSGHLGQQVLHHIHSDKDDKVIGFFDDFKETGSTVKEIPILGNTNDILEFFQKGIFDELIIAIGYKHLQLKKRLFENFRTRIPFYSFIHSTSIIDSSAKIGEGTIIYPNCMIDQNVEIGENTLINISCTLSHDSTLGNHCFLAPSVSIAGFANISELCFIGINSTIIDNLTISERIQLGGGTVVIKNLEIPGLYVGNPARLIRQI